MLVCDAVPILYQHLKNESVLRGILHVYCGFGQVLLLLLLLLHYLCIEYLP